MLWTKTGQLESQLPNGRPCPHEPSRKRLAKRLGKKQDHFKVATAVADRDAMIARGPQAPKAAGPASRIGDARQETDPVLRGLTQTEPSKWQAVFTENAKGLGRRRAEPENRLGQHEVTEDSGEYGVKDGRVYNFMKT